MLIQHKHGRIVPCVIRTHHDQRAIIQYQPLLVVADGHDGMDVMVFHISHDHQSQVGQRDARLVECHIFGDSVILAVTGAGAEHGQRRRPVVSNTVLDPIAYRPDAQVDGAINFAEPGTTFTLPAKLNDG
jgi:hypothetical protein